MATISSRNGRIAPTVLSALLLLLLVCHALADTPTPSLTLGPYVGDLKLEPGMKAAGKNLRDTKIVGYLLSGAIFDRADLSGMSFAGCDLSYASFKGAHLDKASIYDCNILGADFTDAIIAGLRSDGYLSSDQLQSTRSYKTKDLRECGVISAYDSRGRQIKPVYDFRGADLRGARLSCGDFTACDFTDARIDRIGLNGCTMTFKQLASTKDFKHRRLRQTGLDAAFDEDPDYSGIDLTASLLRNYPKT